MNRLFVGVGEVLWDLLPSGKQLGGAPVNFAYHAHVLGATALPVSRVGDDDLGRQILQQLASLNIDTRGISTDSEAPTGTVTVEVAADGQPKFTIHENVAWDRIPADPELLAQVRSASAICFGSLGQRSEPSGQTIRGLVRATSEVALRIFDINLRPPFVSRAIIEPSLAIANALKLNDAELPVLAQMLDLPGTERQQLVALSERFNLRLVALTRGAKGSLLLSRGRISEHGGKSVKVADAVGAGDSFTAAMAIGYLAGWDLGVINERANAVAAYVCTQPGATPALPAELTALFNA